VKVIRLIVKGSIEERILSLQEKKQQLISSAFGKKKGGKDGKEMRVEELRTMLGLDMGRPIAVCRPSGASSRDGM